MVAAITAGCAGSDDTAGADLIINRGKTPTPTRLMLSWFSESGLLFRKPFDLTQPIDDPIARVRILTAEATGRRVAVVQGLSATDTVLSEGAEAITVTPGQVSTHTIALSAGRLPDGDGDGVPDVQDECPADATAFFGCAATPGRSPDARPVLNEPSVLDAAPAAPALPLPPFPKDTGALPTILDTQAATLPNPRFLDAAAIRVDAPIDTAVVRDMAVVLTPPPDAAPTCRAILVCTSGAATEADMVAADLLTAHGCVAVRKDQATLKLTDLAGANLTVLSPSAGESQSYKFLKTATVPLLVLERDAVDDLGMTGTVAGIDFGNQGNEDSIHINMAGHPLAAGLQNTHAILEIPTLSLGWAIPQGTAARIVSLAIDNSRYFAFGYEANATLSGTAKTPARWAAFLAGSIALPRLNPNGEKIFHAAVRWLLTKP